MHRNFKVVPTLRNALSPKSDTFTFPLLSKSKFSGCILDAKIQFLHDMVFREMINRELYIILTFRSL